MRPGKIVFFKFLIGFFFCFCTVAIAAPLTHTISGFVLTDAGVGISGVDAIGVNGAGFDVTGADGGYSIKVPNNWSGMITVSKVGWLLTPVSRTYSKVRSDIANENYIAYQPKISGYVRKTDGTPLPGAMVTANNGGGTTSTDTSGYYELFVPYNWSGALSFNLTGYYFVDKNYTNIIADQTNQNFSGFQPTISGSTTQAGVTVTVSDIGSIVSTPFYSVTVPYGWSGIIEASLTDYYFPESPRSYTNVTEDMPNNDFTAFQPKISGTIRKENGTPIDGVAVYANNGGGSDTTNSSGNYEITVPYNWSGVVNVEKLDWLFEPNNMSYTNIINDQTGQDYIVNFGSGTQNDPYLILDISDFDLIAGDSAYWASGVYVKLMCDLDFSNRSYTTAIIAPDTDDINYHFQGVPFAGIFDGGGHTASNITIDTAGSSNDFLALFGQLEDDAEIENLNLYNMSIMGGVSSHSVGGLVGRNYGIVTDCNITCTVTGDDYIGVLCGYNSGSIISSHTSGIINVTSSNGSHLGGLSGFNSGSIMNCCATVTVSGHYNAGGLCGYNNGSITNSYTSNVIISGDDYTGGLCGENRGIIMNSYATGTIGGDCYVGGLCGKNYSGTITNCYASAAVSGTGYWIGGLCGDNERSSIINCYFYLFGGLDNGCGVALEDFELLDGGNYIGFDFAGNSEDGTNDDWSIIEGHLPKLTWQTDDGPLFQLLDSLITTLSGTGYSNDPFLISSYEDLIEFGTNPALRIGHYMLTNNIDLAGQTYTTAFIPEDFYGRFHGSGYIVSNLEINGYDNIGFFSRLCGDADDFGLENIAVNGNSRVGGICGFNYFGSISNCYTTGTVNGTGYSIGGLCGLSYGIIQNSCTSTVVSGGNRVGGLCGGLILDGNISNSYSTGAVTGDSYVGGLCGYDDSSYDGIITNCYAACAVSGSSDVGGLMGFSRRGAVESYWDTETSGLTVSDAGVGLTTEQMKTRKNFQGFNCTGQWKIDEGNDYPRLIWENVAGRPIIKPVYGGGSGTPGAPYVIYTAEQLYDVGITPCDWDKDFRLVSSLDCSGMSQRLYYPIGNSRQAFQGAFDGNACTIRNLTIHSSESFIGIFGYIGENGFIYNLGISNAVVEDLGSSQYNRMGVLVGHCVGKIQSCFVRGGSITGNGFTGGLAGSVENGVISNCYCTAGVTSQSRAVGGLIGRSDFGNIYRCYVNCEVSGNDYVGGLIGYNRSSAISNSSFKGSVSGDTYIGGLTGYSKGGDVNFCHTSGVVSGNSYVGGLFGRNDGYEEYDLIENSCATNNISGFDYVGGISGYIYSSQFTNCLATGIVDGNDFVGGFAGYQYQYVDSYYFNCFWEQEKNASLAGISNISPPGITGESTANLKSPVTYVNAGWDFVGETVNGTEDFWDICEGTNYPKLTWQIPLGDFICPDGVNFIDFSVLTAAWMTNPSDSHWNSICDISEPNDNIINEFDLEVFLENWLVEIE